MPTTPHEGVDAFVGDAKNSAPQPAAVAGGTFKFKLALSGVPIGWLGLGGASNIWACIVDTKEQAVPFQWYPYSGTVYLFENDGSNHYMTWSGLSGHPVASNAWSYANGWKLEGNRLIATDSNQALSRYSGGTPWLYANNDYTILDVTIELV